MLRTSDVMSFYFCMYPLSLINSESETTIILTPGKPIFAKEYIQ